MPVQIEKETWNYAEPRHPKCPPLTGSPARENQRRDILAGPTSSILAARGTIDVDFTPHQPR